MRIWKKLHEVAGFVSASREFIWTQAFEFAGN
jgi:hypothetical protein